MMKTLTEFGEDGDEEGSSYDIEYRTIGWFYGEWEISKYILHAEKQKR